MLVATSAASAQSAEHLAAPALPGFVVGYSAGNAQQSIREEIPLGETVEAWTRMVTTQRFTGLAQRTSPAAYAQSVLASLPRACPGAAISPVTNVTVVGRPAVRFQVDCPHSAGGRPESFILLAIAGRSDMHVKQAAWRGGTTPATLNWGRQFIASTVLCAPGDKAPACR
ncbi:MAG: hypothetical protein ABIM50_09670 [Novosphingobium sp.]